MTGSTVPHYAFFVVPALAVADAFFRPVHLFLFVLLLVSGSERLLPPTSAAWRISGVPPPSPFGHCLSLFSKSFQRLVRSPRGNHPPTYIATVSKPLFDPVSVCPFPTCLHAPFSPGRNVTSNTRAIKCALRLTPYPLFARAFLLGSLVEFWDKYGEARVVALLFPPLPAPLQVKTVQLFLSFFHYLCFVVRGATVYLFGVECFLRATLFRPNPGPLPGKSSNALRRDTRFFPPDLSVPHICFLFLNFFRLRPYVMVHFWIFLPRSLRTCIGHCSDC